MVNKRPYHAARVNVSRNVFFSSRSEKNIFFGVDIVVKINRNVVYRGLYSYRQQYASLLFSQTRFFLIFSAYLTSLQKFLKGKSDAYKQLICIMQRVGVFNCQDKYLFRYLWYCGKNQIECGLACRGLYCYRQRHHIASSQCSKFVADSLGCASSTAFWPLWWRVTVLDKNKDHANPRKPNVV